MLDCRPGWCSPVRFLGCQPCVLNNVGLHARLVQPRTLSWMSALYTRNAGLQARLAQPQASKPIRQGPHVPWTSGTIDVDLNFDPLANGKKVNPLLPACIHSMQIWACCSWCLCMCAMENIVGPRADPSEDSSYR
eukprot:1084655-Pelagomonas_calceolata.AAC.4